MLSAGATKAQYPVKSARRSRRLNSPSSRNPIQDPTNSSGFGGRASFEETLPYCVLLHDNLPPGNSWASDLKDFSQRLSLTVTGSRAIGENILFPLRPSDGPTT